MQKNPSLPQYSLHSMFPNSWNVLFIDIFHGPRPGAETVDTQKYLLAEGIIPVPGLVLILSDHLVLLGANGC